MMLPERVAACVMVIAIDNNFNCIKPIQWPGFIDYAWLEQKLRPLSESEIETLCTGEEKEAQAIIEKHDIGLVSEFLSMIFDGDLHRFFYIVPEASPT